MRKLTLLTCFVTLLLPANAKTFPGSKYSFGLRIVGHGKPMLLIPGFKGSADTYNNVVAHYKDQYKCYVITLAGFAGQPASGAHDHLLLKQRDDIINYIIDEHLDHPTLVGFSFGGTLALWITCTRPDLIGPLIDLDGTPFDAALQTDHFNKDSLIRDHAVKYARAIDQPGTYWKKRDSAFHSPESIKQGNIYMQKLVTDTNRSNETLVWDIASDFRTGALMDAEADTIDMRTAVSRLKSPVLVLGSWTSWDYKTKADGERDYARLWANAKNVTIVFSDKGRHFLMYDDFNWMIAVMDGFLKKYDHR
jgi:N-formylmaleamate deformylase